MIKILIILFQDPTQRDIFYRERDEGTYGTSAFFISYFLAEFPFEVLAVLIFALIDYAIIVLRVTWQAFLIYTFTLFNLTFSGESLGLILCSLFEGVGLANTLATFIHSS